MSRNSINSQSRIKKRKHKVKKRRKKLFFIIPLLILLIPTVWLGYLYAKANSAVSDAYENDGREKSHLRETVVDPKVDNVSILILGIDESDHRGNQGHSRTDTMILATLNKEERSIKLLSIPRDSYVYIPHLGYHDKINHAHYFGGTRAAIETVENLLEVPVDYFVKVNFNAFIEVVDALNGIEVEVPYEFRESDSNDRRDTIHLLPGRQVLNGEEALALARTRKHDNDIERGKRQLDIIKAVADKALSLSSVLKIDNVIDAVGDNMSTNMTFGEMQSFLSYGLGGNLSIESDTLAGSDYWPENIYYWQIDEVALAEKKRELQEHLELIPKQDHAGTSGTETQSGTTETGGVAP